MSMKTTEWETKSLDELTDRIDYGHTASADSEAVGPKFLRITDIQNGHVDWKTVPFCPATPDELDKYRLSDGDIVFARTGNTTGKSFLLKHPPEDSVFASYLIRVRPSRSVNPRFLAHFFDTPNYWNQIKKNAQGAGQPGVNATRLKTLEIPLPPLPEQKRIADILDRADAIRRKRQEATKQCNDFLTSAFNSMFGDPVQNPKKWPETTLDDVAHLQSGVTKGRNFADQQTVDVPYMRVWNVQDGHLRLDDIKDITVLPTDVERYSLQEGDLLLTEGGDPDQLGRGAIWYAPIPVCIHQNHIFRVRCDQKVIIPEFLSALIGSQKGKRYFLKMAKQTTGIASINMTQLRKCPVFLPPLHLQQQFAKLDRQFEKTCGTLNKRFDTVDQLFGSLVQRAFNGKL